MPLFDCNRPPLPFLRVHPLLLGNLSRRLDFCHNQQPPFMAAVCRCCYFIRLECRLPATAEPQYLLIEPDPQSGQPRRQSCPRPHFAQLDISIEPWSILKTELETPCLPRRSRQAKTGPLSSVICPLSSVICLPSSVFCPLSSVLCHLSSVICHPSFVLCLLSSVIRLLSSVFCPLSSVVCHPSSVFCHPSRSSSKKASSLLAPAAACTAACLFSRYFSSILSSSTTSMAWVGHTSTHTG